MKIPNSFELEEVAIFFNIKVKRIKYIIEFVEEIATKAGHHFEVDDLTLLNDEFINDERLFAYFIYGKYSEYAHVMNEITRVMAEKESKGLPIQ